MSQTPGSFRPSELDGADQRATDADLAGAWSTARELEAALPAESIMPSAGFADRVMAAVALEPAPRPAGFLAVLRDRPGLAGLVASVREAWAVVAGGPGRPIRARGLALAYVLAVLVIGTSLTGVATYGAAGALGLLDGDASPTPTVQESIEPSTTPPPSPSPTPTITPPTPTESSRPIRGALRVRRAERVRRAGRQLRARGIGRPRGCHPRRLRRRRVVADAELRRERRFGQSERHAPPVGHAQALADPELTGSGRSALDYARINRLGTTPGRVRFGPGGRQGRRSTRHSREPEHPVRPTRSAGAGRPTRAWPRPPPAQGRSTTAGRTASRRSSRPSHSEEPTRRRSPFAHAVTVRPARGQHHIAAAPTPIASRPGRATVTPTSPTPVRWTGSSRACNEG